MERHGIDLRSCGEMAGDPMCVAILIGLGYRHLSMNGRSVARLNTCRGALIMPKQKILRSVVWSATGDEVRHQVAAFMERRGWAG
ncbi:putative PEP-binding protein [Shigella flexneri]